MVRRVPAGLCLLTLTLVAIVARPVPSHGVVPTVTNVYWLPWDGGVQRTVSQGNSTCGSGTHCGVDEYAWDISGSGWLVRAARGGVVSAVRDDSASGGCDPSQSGKANFVKIMHDDGIESLYAHLATGSVTARGIIKGQRLSAYAPIGVSDSTGFVCGPHLHYQAQDVCTAPDGFCQSRPSSFQDAGVPATGASVTSGNHVPWRDLFLYRREVNGAGELHAASGTGGWSVLGSDNFGTNWKVFRGYFNTDALEDILLFNGSGGSGNTATMKLYFANGTGSWTLAYDSGGGFRNAWRIYPGDYGDASAAGTTGKPDGLTDLFLYDGGQPGQITATGLLMYATGTGGWIFGEDNSTFLPSWKVYPGEFGSVGAARDGLTDLLLYNGVVATDLGNGATTAGVGGPVEGGGCEKATGQVLFSDGNLDRFWGQGTPKTDFCRDLKVYLGDYGNKSVLNPGTPDGLMDVFMYNGTGQAGSLASGQIFFATGAGAWIAGDFPIFDGDWQIFVGDYGDGIGKADGRADLFLYNGKGTSATNATGLIYFSKGDGTWSPGTRNSSFRDDWLVFPAHFGIASDNRADEMTDLFLYDRTSQTVAGSADRVVIFATGFGTFPWPSSATTQTLTDWTVVPLSYNYR